MIPAANAAEIVGKPLTTGINGSSESGSGSDPVRLDFSGSRPILDSVIVTAPAQGNSFTITGLAQGVVAKSGPGGSVSLKKKNALYGELAASFAIDANLTRVPSSFKVVKGQLRQVIEVNELTEYPVTLAPAYVRNGNSEDAEIVATYHAVLQTPPVTGEDGGGGMIQPFAVGISIPWNYVYNTNHPQKTLHDYCSYSPDMWLNADFRGSCARHDMCLEPVVWLPIDQRKARRAPCDFALLANLNSSCGMAYPNGNFACRSVAATYYATVSARTWVWPV